MKAHFKHFFFKAIINVLIQLQKKQTGKQINQADMRNGK